MSLQLQNNILYDPVLMPEPQAALFEPLYWLARHTGRSAQAGRGNVLFIDEGDRHWVLRHYRRGGLIGKLIHDQYAWRGAEATRPFKEARLLAMLRDQQLPVPTPVAARYVRRGLRYRADLITAAIPNVTTFAQCLMNGQLAIESWQAVGKTLARFHAAGVHHADLNANNILLDTQQRVWVLDFDRGQLRKFERAWVNKVLARLLRSLNKLRERKGLKFEMTEWRALLQAHDEMLVLLAKT